MSLLFTTVSPALRIVLKTYYRFRICVEGMKNIYVLEAL